VDWKACKTDSSMRRFLGLSFREVLTGLSCSWRKGRSTFYLTHGEEVEWQCPECGHECTLYDHQPERQWPVRREALPLNYIGVDEKAFRKGHKYLTLVKRP
jgi:hypothetical protein